MQTTTGSKEEKFSLANEKKREWVLNLLKMSRDEKAQEAFQKFQQELNGKLYDYSFSNYFGLCVQTFMRESYSFQFASFNKWKSLKRFVKKGEKGMSVLVPTVITRKDESGNIVIDPKTGQPKTFTYYTVKNGVFGIDQTEGLDGEKFESFRTVVNFKDWMFDNLYDKLKTKYVIDFQVMATSMGGFTDGKRICINSERDKASQFCTMVHELSHCMLEHHTEAGREIAGEHKETEAELSTLIYCTLAGIESKGSAYYLDSVDLAEVDIRHINRAIKTAGKIYEDVHGKREKKEEVA